MQQYFYTRNSRAVHVFYLAEQVIDTNLIPQIAHETAMFTFISLPQCAAASAQRIAHTITEESHLV